MSFIVTARKYRPQRFDEVVGQEHITKTLKNAINMGRIAHAYLFTGPRGVGKTTTARILAKAVNCLNSKDSEPCNNCEMCLSIQNSQLMDIIEIDAASNRGIDEIRSLRESVKYAPSKGKYKIYIIDEVHMLTRDSFNAFLKTLEEPPSHTIFIFATTDVHRVPTTIVSRCQRYDFRRIQMETIKSLLKKIAESEKIEIDDKTLTLIAKKSDGGLRDAESFFDQAAAFCGGKIDFETVVKVFNFIDDDVFFDVSDAMLNKNFKAAFDIAETIYKNGWNFVDFLDGLIEHYRNLMAAAASGSVDLIETAEVYKERTAELASNFSEGDLLRILNYLNKTSQELRYSQNHKLKIEVALCHIIGLERSATISELIKAVNSGAAYESEPVKESSGVNYSSEKKTPDLKESSTVKTTQISHQKKSVIPNTKSVPSGPLQLSHIESNWQGFVDVLRTEKPMTFNGFTDMIKPRSLDGDKLDLKISSEEGMSIFKLHEDYFKKKAEEYFGRRFSFNFDFEEDENPSQENEIITNEPKTESKSKKRAKNEPEADPYVNSILEELGGEEIHN